MHRIFYRKYPAPTGYIRRGPRIYPALAILAKDLIQKLADGLLMRTGTLGGNIRPHRNFRPWGRIYPVRRFSLNLEDRSLQWVLSGAPEIWAEISAPHRNFRSEGRIFPVLVRIYPVLGPDISGVLFLCNGQNSWRGINTPPPTSGQVSPPTFKSTIGANSDLQLLPIHPTISADLWRIEGEGPDLRLHRAVFHFSLILLRAPC